ncbi:unnamed protein product [Dibothriocephalus latus]|uniref:Uncharacterized protein n=1 Tax=Dibothriocephalus latus TaxID=60516 RepID=A0A3P7NA68_DIBLA|nr:unnamed protein product [Dibothriocephalus latus]
MLKMTLLRIFLSQCPLFQSQGFKNRPLRVVVSIVLTTYALLLGLYVLSQSTQHSAKSTSYSLSSAKRGREAVCASDWYASIWAKIGVSYRLQLKVPVDPTVAKTHFDRVSSSIVVKYDSCPCLLSFEDMAEIEDRFWRLRVGKQVYRLYPQSLNMSDVVIRVKCSAGGRFP